MPSCKYCGKKFSSNVIRIHERWCKEQKEIKETKKIEKGKKGVTDITKLNVEPAIDLIEQCQDIEQIMAWLSEESQGKKRKTVVEVLEAKMKELEDNNQVSDNLEGEG